MSDPVRLPRRPGVIHRIIAARRGCGLVLSTLAALPAAGQVQEWNVPSMLPEATKKEEGAEAQPKFRFRAAFDYPLRTGSGGATSAGAGTQGAPAVSPTVQAELRAMPASYWFASVIFYQYLYPDRQRPWNPDFTYSFGYDDWHPNTVSLVYSNYSGNRLNPGPNETYTNFRQGTWSLGYKFKPPAALDSILKFDPKHEIGCSINANLTPRYSDLRTLSIRSNKHTVALGCRYMLPNNLFAQLTAFHYPDRRQQQPWDPDFTYSFGYFDWRPGTVSVQYSNYSGNRYPWRDSDSGEGGFRRGSVSISWSRSW